MKKSLEIIDKIRSLDETIRNNTAEPYTRFIAEIYDRVKEIGDQIKNYIKMVKEGQEVEYGKLKSRLELFGNLKWIDEYFGQVIVERTYKKAINRMN
jgi:hypothetical protein